MTTLRSLLLIAACLLVVAAGGQTMIPLPAHNNPYSTTVRGYWFVAPTNFTITGLRVSPDAGSGDQYIHLMKINDNPPVTWATMSSNFTTLAYIQAATNGVVQNVNVSVNSGDIIGVLGHVGTGVVNSYSAPATPFSSTIGTFSITLNRLLHQAGLTSGPAYDYSTEGSGYPIGRVEMYYTIGPPCPTPGGLNATSITSQTATVSWNAVPASIGYEYVVNTTATPPTTAGTATTATSHGVTGLTPSTAYYLHVRNKCTGGGISQWVTYSFNTLPPCKPPVNFHTTNLQPTTTTINWDPWPSALNYDYVVDQVRDDPTSTTGIINVTTTGDNLSGLSENTWYYVHIRSHCVGAEISGWSLDSFQTPIPCRAPVLNVSNVNTDEAVVYWDEVPTATHYEYAITTSATPPALGTKYNYNTLHTPALYDGKDYFVHVRSHCVSIGVQGRSDWATASFKTWPVHVGSTAGGGFSIAVYPNPVKNIMTVKVGGVNGAAAIAVTDASGKAIYTGEVVSGKAEIDMGGLAPGFYMVKYTDDARSEVIKVSKQ